MTTQLNAERALYRRFVRRSRHRSRSAAVIVALSVIALAAVYVGIESVLAALGQGPMLIAPDAAVAALERPEPVVLVGTAVVGLLGIVFLFLAVLPGARGRHELPNERLAIVVDDGVLAGAIGRTAQRAAGVAPGRVQTTVSARRGTVSITPTSGLPLDREALAATAQEFVETLAPRPTVTVAVAVAANGVVGS